MSEFVDFAPESAKQQKISSLHHAGVNKELKQTTTMQTILYKSSYSVKLSDLCKKKHDMTKFKFFLRKWAMKSYLVPTFLSMLESSKNKCTYSSWVAIKWKIPSLIATLVELTRFTILKATSIKLSPSKLKRKWRRKGGISFSATNPNFFSTSFPDYFSKKFILIDKIIVSTGVWTGNFYVHDRAKWDLGWATSERTSGTRLKHWRDKLQVLSKHFWGYLWFLFYQNWTRVLIERTVSSNITICMAVMYVLVSIWKCGLPIKITLL